MNSTKWSVFAALIAIVCVCGCTSYDAIVERWSEGMAGAKARPLPLLPTYPEGDMPSYRTDSRLAVHGNREARDALCAALKESGYHVMGDENVYASVLQPPDLVLCVTWTNSVEYGDGAAWIRGKLVVSLRSPVRLDANGIARPMSRTRCFQAHARAKISDAYALWCVYEPLLKDPHLGEYYTGLLTGQTAAIADGKKAKQEAMKIAASRLMHIGAFRQAISMDRQP